MLKIRWSLGIWVLAALLSSCGTTHEKSTSALPTKTEPSPYTFIDSTEYFADRTASVSMRASFDTRNPSAMSSGYKFQFRTISETPILLNSISIIAGGKRIFIEPGQVVLPKHKSVTLSLPLEASQFIATFPSALLQFKHNNISQLLAITLHRLQEFDPHP
ncbi:MAG: hypothetical protein KTR20_10330 [Cellvibrionaceae bacterium]|nr:hypothetical protein [Cellvibrionaceae bacterium]